MSNIKEKKSEIGICNALGSSELEILDYLWRTGEATVREVYEETRKTRNITLPAVMLSMERLTKRGVLLKTKGERAAIYKPLMTRENIGYNLLTDVVDRVLQGSTGSAVSHLVEKLSKEELKQITAKIKDIKG